MKKLFITLIAFLSTATAAMASTDSDRPIVFEQLPLASQEFIKTHFPEAKISLTTVDREAFETTYEVYFKDGRHVEFYGNGKWKEIDCEYSRVPLSAIPKQIQDYLSENYGDSYVVGISNDRRDYEVELNSGFELIFDRSFRLIGFDD
jgi:hypothetical protein